MVFLLTGCVHMDTTVNRKDLNGFDFKLFQGTRAWNLAKATDDENVSVIKKEIGNDHLLINFKEPKFGQTLLQLAVKNQKIVSVKALLDLGADPNLQDNYDGSSPMMESAKIFNETVGGPDVRYLKLMLQHGGDANAAEATPRRPGNSTRETPLLNACSDGIFDYVEILVEAGADINYKNEFGGNALYSAIISKNPDIVMYLLEKGADFRHPMTTYPAIDMPGLHQKRVSLYIMQALKSWRFPPGSEKDQKKIKIVSFLKEHGIN